MERSPMHPTSHHPDRLSLPDGRLLDLRRPRSAGPLDATAVAACRAGGVPLAYDPVQGGWVPASAVDDIDPRAAGEAGLPCPAPAAARVRLRPWRAEEAERLLALLDNPRVWRYLPERPPARLDLAAAEALVALANTAAHHEVLAIEHEGAPVGQVRLATDPAAPDWREAEIGYWLGEAHWGLGLASEAVRLMTRRGFAGRPELGAIVARVHEDNPASARVLARLGYREEGRDPADPAWRLFRLRRREAEGPLAS
jgi:RimJ/RimL family protein N-acetyltransferase